MAEFRNTGRSDGAAGATISDEVVSKIGKAAGQINEIRRTCQEQVAMAANNDQKRQMTENAEQAAVQAIGALGLTVDQYNDVITAAEDDAPLARRLLAAAGRE